MTKLVYKNFVLYICHSYKDLKKKQYFIGSCWDVELYSFLKFNFEEVKEMFIKQVEWFLEKERDEQ